MGWMLLGLAVLLVFMNAARSKDLSEEGRVLKRVTAKEALAFWDGGRGAQLLDVRTSGEVAQGTLRGAKHADVLSGDFDEAAGKLPRDRPVVVFCRSGNRSLAALARLKALGFRHVLEVEGGIGACLSAGFPPEAREGVRK